MSTKAQQIRVEDETPENEMPEGWVAARLTSIATVEWGNTAITKKSYVPKGFPAFSASGQDGFLPSADWHGGAVVLSAIGARCGKCFYAEGSWTAIKNTIVIQADERNISNRYLWFFLNDENRWAISGSGQPFITMTAAGQVQVPIAPRLEQDRISKRVEELVKQVGSTRERLGKAAEVLKHFRQAVLAAACSGKLTEDWRSTHRTSIRLLPGGGMPIKTLTNASEANLYELPESWGWVTFDEMCNDITVGHVGPMAHEYIKTGVPFLRSQNVREFRFEPAGLKFISRTFHQQLRKSALHPGDVAIVRSGYPGTSCVIPDSLPEANCADLVIVRPSAGLNPTYACIFINSTSSRKYVEAEKVGIAQGHFNVGSMRNAPLPLPTLAEQEEIVRRVNALFKLADAIDKRVAAATLRAEKLTQAILAKAFRGELVPTEAELARREGRDYEPASALLERVKTEENRKAGKQSRLRIQKTPRGEP